MKKKLLTLFIGLFSIALTFAALPKVLVCGSSFDPAWNVDVQTKLMATGQFSAVDVFNTYTGTPTLAQLQAYEAVLAYTNNKPNNATLLGDNLASYIDAGGGVVDAVGSFDVTYGIKGNFNTSTYLVLATNNFTFGTPLTLGAIQLPAHPIMAGVTNFSGGTSSFNIPTTLTAGAYEIARWSNGIFLIDAKENVGPLNARRATLNFFPPSSDLQSDFWTASTDGGLIMANALTWVAKGACTTTYDTIYQSICLGDTFTFNGIGQTTAGLYNDTLMNVGGCDSVLTLDLTVNTTPAPAVAGNSSSINVSISGICDFLSGIYNLTGTVNGKNNYVCSQYPIYQIGFDGMSWVHYAGNMMSNNGFINSTSSTGILPPATGWLGTQCSGSMTIAPIVASASYCTPATVANLTQASGSNIQWYDVLTGGTALAPAAALVTGTYYVSQTINGCESNRDSLLVTVNQPTTSTLYDTICASALPYTWNDSVFTAAGIKVAHLINVAGCDSAATMNLTVNALPTLVCAGNDTFFTDAGVCTKSGATLTLPTYTTPCGFSMLTNNAPSLLPMGIDTIKWIVKDASGNKDSCQQLVIVRDTSRPIITCPANITVSNGTGICGAVVNFAPTATDNCGVASGTQTFSYSGTIKTFTVPSGVTNITIEAKGAEGGFSSSSMIPPGLGASIKGSFNVTPGQVLKVLVGGRYAPSNGGGGGSFVTDLTNNPLVVAGGGGGSSAGNDSPDKHGQAWTSGGMGSGGGGFGGTSGSGGLIGASGFQSGAGGGLLTNGADGWTAGSGGHAFVNGGAGANLGFGIGGFGGGGNGSGYVVGGGGGGYSGGGSGSNSGGGGVGGGGGSFNGGTNQVNIAGINSGNGLVVITWSGISATVTQTEGLPTGSTFPVGTSTVKFVATDLSGNVSDTCSFTVTVSDTTKPTIACGAAVTQANDAGVCGGTVVLTNPTTADNCGVDTLYNDAPTLFPVGNTTVTWTVKDTSGNTATCTQLVTVNDTTKPTITCAAAVTQANDAGVCGATVVLTNPTTADNCGVDTLYNDAPTLFSVGNTTVTWTVKDTAGNSATCTQLVTVNDTTKPTITCTADIVVSNTAGGSAIINPVSVTSNMVTDFGIDLINTINGAGLSIFPSLTANHDATTPSNSWVSSSNSGEIIFDLGAIKTIYGLSFWNQNDGGPGAAGSSGIQNVQILSSTDNINYTPIVGAPSVFAQVFALGGPPEQFSFSPVSASYIKFIVVSNYGDNYTGFAEVAFSGVSSAAMCGAVVSLTAPTTADNCGVKTITNDAPSVFPVGTTTVTWTVKDTSGNTATCTQLVTVSDTTKPTITCGAAVTQANDAGVCGATVILTNPTTADNCGVDTLYNDAPALFPVGTTTVTWTVKDTTGNSATCTQLVTVNDTTKPTITCGATVTQANDAGICGATVVLANPTTADNCGVDTLYNDAPSIFPLGSTTVTWTVKDTAGNSATCTQLVMVTDTTKPTALCKNGSIAMDTITTSAQLLAMINNGSFDNCSIKSMMVSPDTFNCNNLGANNVTLTVTDSSNNVGTCVAIITVLPSTIISNTAVLSNYNGYSVSCHGATDGKAVVSASGGYATLSYAWSNGQTTDTLYNVGAGIYYVTITDANLCTKIDSVIITEPASFVITHALSNYTGYNVSCFGSNDGTAALTVTGGTGSYSYAWSDAGVGNVPNNNALTAGLHTITVTDQNSCFKIDSFTFTQPSQVLTTMTATSALCNGNANGTATVTATGGVGSFTYNWNTTPVQTTATATALAAGVYTVTVKDGNNCVASNTIAVTEPAALTVSGSVTSNYNGYSVSCNGGANGAAQINVNGGSTAYSYAWPASTGVGNVATASTLMAGTYMITVSDANGCSGNASITITEPAALSASAAVTSNYNGAQISCATSSDGKVTATGTGGTGIYTYKWNTIPVQTGATATGLTAGTYTATITDANGCTATASSTITAPTALSIALPAPVGVSCHGGADGSVSIAAFNGTGTINYTWPVSTGVGNTGNGTGLLTGTYQVTVIDANNCTATTNVTITEPTALSLATSTVDVTSFGGNNGTATASVTGGTGVYTYNWNTTPAQTTATATGLTAGTYNVTVTDANGCSITASVVIHQPSSPLVLTMTNTSSFNGYNVSCNGSTNGSASVTVTGGAGVYTYNWNTTPAQTTATITNVGAGTYTVIVTDGNSTTASASITITEPAALSASAAVTSNYNGAQISCATASNGVLAASATGGVAPLSYIWNTSPAQSGNTAINVAAGTYTVTITDVNNCSSTATVTITAPTAVVATSAVTSNYNGSSVSCYGSTNGSASVAATGGTGAYTYSWPTATGLGNVDTATSLAAGSYTITVSDANACQSTTTITVTQPTLLTSSTAKIDALCFGANNGKAWVTAAGGTSPYTYIWNTTPAQTTDTAMNLTAGTYSVTVTDTNGCTTISTVTINQPTALSLSLSAVDVTCPNGNDGTATVVATGGTPNYSYIWNTTPAQTTATATGLTVGRYKVTVTDVNGCTTNDSIQINVKYPTLPTSRISGGDTICAGEPLPNVQVVLTGTAPYSFTLHNGTSSQNYTGVTTSPFILSNAAAGSYWITNFSDAHCTGISTDTTNVKVNPLPQASLSGGGNVCDGANLPAIEVALTGTANWQVAVDWANGRDTTITVNSLPYTIQPTEEGTYLVKTVTDGNGCSSTNINASASVGYYLLPLVDAGEMKMTDKGFAVQLDGKVINAYGGVNFISWTPDTTLDNGTIAAPYARPLTTTLYTISATDKNGCSATDTVTVLVRDRIILDLINIFTPDGDGINEKFVIKNLDAYPNMHLIVVDRWEQIIYENKNYDNSWDGTWKGKPVDDGTYYYVIAVPGLKDAVKGPITIIRKK